MSALNNTLPNTHLDLYKYLLVLTEGQIVKLRNIALGILSPSSFSNDEIEDLENDLSRALAGSQQ